MFAPVRYIAWTRGLYGQVPFDLATSGIPTASFRELGVAEPTLAELEDVAAYPRLVSAIARHNDVSEVEVVPALGTSQGIFLAYAAMLSLGDEVLVESPGYEPLTRTAQGLGATVRTFERREDEGFRVVPERVAAAMTPRTRAIVVTNLHNPTGTRTPPETLRELAAIAAAQGAYLLVDEVYAAFDDLPEDGVFRGSARKLGDNVVTVSSLTKCYGLGFHRVGWLLGPEAIVAAANDAIIATCGHLPLSHAARGATALAHVGRLATRARALLAGKREVAASWAKDLPRARWSAPTAGLFGMLTLNEPGEPGELLARIETWAKRDGVLVGAGVFFGAPAGFRLSWATLPAADFARGLDKLGSLLR